MSDTVSAPFSVSFAFSLSISFCASSRSSFAFFVSLSHHSFCDCSLWASASSFLMSSSIIVLTLAKGLGASRSFRSSVESAALFSAEARPLRNAITFFRAAAGIRSTFSCRNPTTESRSSSPASSSLAASASSSLAASSAVGAADAGRAARGRLRRNVVRDPLPVPTGCLLLLGDIAHRRAERVLARLDGGCLVDFRRPLRDEPQIRAAVHLRNVALEHFECIRDRCQLAGPRLRPRVPIARLRLALGGEVVEEIFVRFHSSRRFLKVRAERGELLRQLRARGPFLLLDLVHHIDIVAASLG